MKNLRGEELNITTMLVMCYMKTCKKMLAMLITRH